MNPNDLGDNFTVSSVQKICIEDLVRKCKVQIKEMLVGSELQVMGIKVELTTSKTGFGGTRLWFKCPICKKRIGTLYQNPVDQAIGCRSCLGIRYRKQRYKGMIEGMAISKKPVE